MSQVVAGSSGIQLQAEQHDDQHDHTGWATEAKHQPAERARVDNVEPIQPEQHDRQPDGCPDISKVGRHAIPRNRIHSAIGSVTSKAVTSSANSGDCWRRSG
jgi:hypothetical protein